MNSMSKLSSMHLAGCALAARGCQGACMFCQACIKLAAPGELPLLLEVQPSEAP